MSFVKHDYAKEKKTKKPKLTLQEDNNASDQGNWPSDRLDNFLEALREYELKSGKTIGWTHILPQRIDDQEETLISPIKCQYQLIN